MKTELKDDCKVLYTDTDSLIYEIKNINMYDIMRNNITHFDTSAYPLENQFNMPLKNKKIVGRMQWTNHD